MWLLVAAIVVSVGGTALTLNFLGSSESITGKYVEDLGTATVTQGGDAGISLTDTTVNFGGGYVDPEAGVEFCELNSDDPTLPSCWIETSTYLPNGADFHVVENVGSTLLNIVVDTNLDNSEELFCGGDCEATEVAEVRIFSDDMEVGSCTNGLISGSSETLLSTDAEWTQTVCGALNYEDTADSIEIGYEFDVPKDATTGVKEVTITYIGTAL